MVRQLTLLVLLSSLSGCGFHLRGNMELPEGFGQIHISAPAAIKNELEIGLDSNGVSVATDADGADAIVSVRAERFARRVLSVDPTTGKEREFELSYVVDFDAQHGDGRPLLDHQNVSLLREYVFDADAVIGKSREEAVLRSEMRRDAALQILRRLETALKR